MSTKVLLVKGWTVRIVIAAAAAMARPDSVRANKAPQPNDSEPKARFSEVPLKQITIEDKFWSPRLKVNRTKTLDHVYQELEATGCLRNFDIAAGKTTGKFGGPWWADSDVYKWIEGASYVLGSHPDPALEHRVDDLISRIEAAQEPDGYLNTHVQIQEPDLRFKDLAFFTRTSVRATSSKLPSRTTRRPASDPCWTSLCDWAIASTALSARESATGFRVTKASSSPGSPLTRDGREAFLAPG